ncbi:MAG: flagellar basal body rod protein FlgC [Verrucomicrobiia bacterium]
MIDFIPGISGTAAALNAERIRMEVVSQNIANASTTRGPNGLPYQRQQVVFETVLQQRLSGSGSAGVSPQSVKVARVLPDTRPARTTFIPGHPDADANGMVKMPNVNIHEEMADLITSSRTYEANLAVIKNARQMALQTLAISKH